MYFIGSSSAPTTFSIRFTGRHSSTQAELVALRLGCQHVGGLGSFDRITFVSDSQAALLSLAHPRRCLSLAAQVYSALQELSASGTAIQLWWTPGHSSLMENDLADTATKAAAQAASVEVGLVLVPSSYSCLRIALRYHYVDRLER